MMQNTERKNLKSKFLKSPEGVVSWYPEHRRRGCLLKLPPQLLKGRTGSQGSWVGGYCGGKMRKFVCNSSHFLIKIQNRGKRRSEHFEEMKT